jgi:hypothetical protein
MEDGTHDPPQLGHFGPLDQWLLRKHFVMDEGRDWVEKARKETMDDFVDSLPGLPHARVTENATAIDQYRQRNLVGFVWVLAWAWPYVVSVQVNPEVRWSGISPPERGVGN